MEGATQQEEMKKCPACAELILVEAKKCKHCGEWLGEPAAALSRVSRPSNVTAVREMPPRRDGRTVLGALLGAIPGLLVFSIILVEVMARVEGRKPPDQTIKAVLLGLVIAGVIGTAAGALLRLVYPWSHRKGSTALVLGVFGALYALLLYVLQMALIEGALEGTSAWVRPDGAGPPAFALIAVFTALASVFLGVRLTRREELLQKAVLERPAVSSAADASPAPTIANAAPSSSTRHEPQPTATCPYCSKKIFEGAKVCMHCWKRLA